MHSNKTLKELVHDHNWLSVSSVLIALYPEEEENLEGYEDVFNQLKIMASEDSDMFIVLQTVIDGDEQYVDVYGKQKYSKDEDDDFPNALEFTPWSQWLNMEISAESLEEFTELEILAHCLFEMTFVAFDEVEIQDELNSFKKSVEDYRSMTEAERAENTMSWEELFEGLEDLLEDFEEDDEI